MELFVVVNLNWNNTEFIKVKIISNEDYKSFLKTELITLYVLLNTRLCIMQFMITFVPLAANFLDLIAEHRNILSRNFNKDYIQDFYPLCFLTYVLYKFIIFTILSLETCIRMTIN